MSVEASSQRLSPRVAVTILFALMSVAAAPSAPIGELVREQRLNYRLAGPLPVGWQRRGTELVWVFSKEGIPHAYVHFSRQRLKRDIDVAKALARRKTHYRFPGMEKSVTGTVRTVTWGDRKAIEYRLDITLSGVRCLRRVRVLCFDRVWYESIETIYGKGIEKNNDACREGLAIFDSGFRILVGPLPVSKPGTIMRDVEQRYALPHPQAMKRTRPSPAQDPGCRVVLETTDSDPRHRLRIRLFEYGAREQFDPKTWATTFFRAFQTTHENAKQSTIQGFHPPGATCVLAVRFSGMRDGQPVHTDIYLFSTTQGRVIHALRLRKRGEGAVRYAKQIRTVREGLRLGAASDP